ncbi:hypothetical protein KM043_003640 [Ampulex compressa]|nr:hypothetical protein KM043_003640 [Ampulex compressa]
MEEWKNPGKGGETRSTREKGDERGAQREESRRKARRGWRLMEAKKVQASNSFRCTLSRRAADMRPNESQPFVALPALFLPPAAWNPRFTLRDGGEEPGET